MFLTHDMAAAFGDWLECRRIQRALVAEIPSLAGAITPDGERPLLRIRRPAGDAVIVARACDDTAGRWIIGIPMRPAPILHDTDTWDEAVHIVLDVLGQPGAGTAADGFGKDGE